MCGCITTTGGLAAELVVVPPNVVVGVTTGRNCCLFVCGGTGCADCKFAIGGVSVVVCVSTVAVVDVGCVHGLINCSSTAVHSLISGIVAKFCICCCDPSGTGDILSLIHI